MTGCVAYLTKELVWRLGAIHLQRRHIEIIDEEDHPFARRWTEQSLPFLLQLRFEHVLDGRYTRSATCGDNVKISVPFNVRKG